MFGDQPEAADLGRKCEIRRVELETDLPWCQFLHKRGGCPLGKDRATEDRLRGKDSDVDIDRLVTTTPGVESSTGFGNVTQTIQS